MEDMKKCKHPSCSCMVAKGGEHHGYCSEHCKDAGDTTEIKCDCKHPACT